jgi:hypothetical protein
MRIGLRRCVACRQGSPTRGIERFAAHSIPIIGNPCAHARQRGSENAGRLPGRPQDAQAETVARQFVRVGEQKIAFRQQGQPRDTRNSPALDRHLDFGGGSQGRNRTVGTGWSAATWCRRIMSSVQVIGLASHAGVGVVPADHHVITATGFGPRRRQHSTGQQRQGCRRGATRDLPRRLRDHE